MADDGDRPGDDLQAAVVPEESGNGTRRHRVPQSVSPRQAEQSVAAHVVHTAVHGGRFRRSDRDVLGGHPRPEDTRHGLPDRGTEGRPADALPGLQGSEQEGSRHVRRHAQRQDRATLATDSHSRLVQRLHHERCGQVLSGMGSVRLSKAPA